MTKIPREVIVVITVWFVTTVAIPIALLASFVMRGATWFTTVQHGELTELAVTIALSAVLFEMLISRGGNNIDFFRIALLCLVTANFLYLLGNEDATGAHQIGTLDTGQIHITYAFLIISIAFGAPAIARHSRQQ